MLFIVFLFFLNYCFHFRQKTIEKFNEKLNEFKNNKKNILILSKQKYNEMISTIERISKEDKPAKLSKDDFNLMRDFSMRVEQSIPVLYHISRSKKENQSTRVITEEMLFDVFKSSHEKLGRAGRDVMRRDLRNYYDISKKIIEIFIKQCVECELKRGKPNKEIVVRPSISDEQNSRCQVDLIDLQSCPVDNYKHIMVYQDHLAKFTKKFVSTSAS